MRNKLILATATAFTIIAAGVTGCKKDEKETPAPAPDIKGTAGNPRFNLTFTNEANVDMDLHVLTPNGTELYYNNSSGDFGALDVDCKCGDCPQGPNENIYFTPGSAPTGHYKFWVEYFGACSGADQPSNFTLRLMRNNDVLQTYSGTLNNEDDSSVVYTTTF